MFLSADRETGGGGRRPPGDGSLSPHRGGESQNMVTQHKSSMSARRNFGYFRLINSAACKDEY